MLLSKFREVLYSLSAPEGHDFGITAEFDDNHSKQS